MYPKLGVDNKEKNTGHSTLSIVWCTNWSLGCKKENQTVEGLVNWQLAIVVL